MACARTTSDGVEAVDAGMPRAGRVRAAKPQLRIATFASICMVVSSSRHEDPFGQMDLRSEDGRRQNVLITHSRSSLAFRSPAVRPSSPSQGPQRPRPASTQNRIAAVKTVAPPRRRRHRAARRSSPPHGGVGGRYRRTSSQRLQDHGSVCRRAERVEGGSSCRILQFFRFQSQPSPKRRVPARLTAPSEPVERNGTSECARRACG